MIGFEKGVDWFHTRTLSNIEDKKPSERPSLDLCETFFDFTDISFNSLVLHPEEVTELKVKYDDDLNLIQIHSLIREKIIRTINKMKNVDNEIYQREWKIANSNVSTLDIKYLNEEIKKLNEFKNKNLGTNHWETYKRAVYPILSKYTPLMSKDVGGVDAPGSKVSFDDEMFSLRHKYINEYISEVNRMGIIKITARCIPRVTPVCFGCMKPLQQDTSIETSCRCGYNESTIKHMSEYNDVNRQIGSLDIEINAKQIKEWLDNVKCTISGVYNKGQDDVKHRDVLFAKFDKLCTSHNLPHRYYVLNGMISQPPMSTILTLLKLAKRPELYNNKHQIRLDYYGYPSYVITEAQEATVIKMFVDFQNTYEETKKRKTRVHIEILGCVLLIMSGVKVNPSDFKIPHSSDTIAYSHNSIYETMGAMGYTYEQIPNVLSTFS